MNKLNNHRIEKGLGIIIIIILVILGIVVSLFGKGSNNKVSSTPPPSPAESTVSISQSPPPTESTVSISQPPPPAESAVWISQQEIMALPASGTAWDNLVNWASQSIGSISINDQDSDSDQVALAKAFTCARIGDHCSELIDALNSLSANPPSGDRVLAWGRNLSSWVIAADIVQNSGRGSGLNVTQFRNWTYNAIRTNSSEGETIIACHEGRPNNWSTMCGGSRIAVDLFDGDSTDLNRAWNEYRGYVGDRSSGALTGNLIVSTNWRCPNDGDRTWINPKGCVRYGHNFDGILPQEMRRQGEYDGTWPPRLGTNYPSNGLAGLVLQAELLSLHGFPSWTIADSALLRAYTWDVEVAGWSVTSSPKTAWMLWVLNKRYGKSFSAPLPALPGQNIGYTDWTHAQ